MSWEFALKIIDPFTELHEPVRIICPARPSFIHLPKPSAHPMALPLKITDCLTFLPLNFLKGVTGQSFIAPFYHTVSDAPLPHIKHLYTVRSAKTFEKDLDFLLEHYTPVGLDDVALSVTEGKALPKNSSFLSFDDGLREFAEVAAPILLKKGVPATCFLNSAFIDNKDLFFRFKASLLIEGLSMVCIECDDAIVDWFGRSGMTAEEVKAKVLSISYAERAKLDELAELIGLSFDHYLRANRPYLESAEIEELQRKGFTFGSHSIDHPLYSDIGEEEQIRQTVESARSVSETFAPAVKAFAFPFTDHGVGRRFFTSVYESSAVQLSFGTAGIKHDSVPGNVQRIPFERGESSAQSLIYNEYAGYMIKSLFGKNKIVR